MDQLDKIILDVAYTLIEQSEAKRVTGSSVWENVGPVLNVAPFVVPVSLRKLVSRGLLAKDVANSSSRTKVYAPTTTGYAACVDRRGLIPQVGRSARGRGWSK